MVKKEETNKKTKANKNIESEETKKENVQNTIVRETITYDNTPIFQKILVCLYVIIALLALNIIITAIRGNVNSTYTTSSDTRDTVDNNGGNNPVVDENINYDVSKFKKINKDGFIDAYKADKLSLIYIGRPTCGFCVKFVPVLTEVQEKYNFKTLYLDTNSVSKSDAQEIINLNESFFTNKETAFGNTPAVLIVKNNEIVDYQIGASDATTLEELVSKHFDKK